MNLSTVFAIIPGKHGSYATSGLELRQALLASEEAKCAEQKEAAWAASLGDGEIDAVDVESVQSL